MKEMDLTWTVRPFSCKMHRKCTLFFIYKKSDFENYHSTVYHADIVKHELKPFIKNRIFPSFYDAGNKL